MTLLVLILALLALGAVAWLTERAPFESPAFKQLIVFVLLVVGVVVVLQFFGVWSAVSSYRFR